MIYQAIFLLHKFSKSLISVKVKRFNKISSGRQFCYVDFNFRLIFHIDFFNRLTINVEDSYLFQAF